MCILEDEGRKQHQEFVQNVIDQQTHSIHNPIKRNSVAFFKRPKHKGKKINVLQNNVALFGQPYISVQDQDGDLEDFLSIRYSPSLSDFSNFIYQT